MHPRWILLSVAVMCMGIPALAAETARAGAEDQAYRRFEAGDAQRLVQISQRYRATARVVSAPPIEHAAVPATQPAAPEAQARKVAPTPAALASAGSVGPALAAMPVGGAAEAAELRDDPALTNATPVARPAPLPARPAVYTTAQTVHTAPAIVTPTGTTYITDVGATTGTPAAPAVVTTERIIYYPYPATTTTVVRYVPYTPVAYYSYPYYTSTPYYRTHPAVSYYGSYARPCYPSYGWGIGAHYRSGWGCRFPASYISGGYRSSRWSLGVHFRF